jgi:hypothetical protein
MDRYYIFNSTIQVPVCAESESEARDILNRLRLIETTDANLEVVEVTGDWGTIEEYDWY